MVTRKLAAVLCATFFIAGSLFGAGTCYQVEVMPRDERLDHNAQVFLELQNHAAELQTRNAELERRLAK